MGRILYQIGDFAVFNHMVASKVSDVGTEEPVTWRINSTELANAPGVYITGQFERPLMGAKTYKVSGSFETSKGMTKDQKVNRVMGLGGRPGIPIIAFEYDDCEHDGITCGCRPTVQWIFALGTITNSQRRTPFLSDNEIHAYDFAALDIDIVLQTPWRRLSPWIWEYRKDIPQNPFSTTNSQLSSDNVFNHPHKVESFQLEGTFYRWADDLIKYSPTFWATKYSNGIDGGFGINYVNVPYRNDFIPVKDTWNAPSTVLYALTNLSATGTAKIRVTYQTGAFFGETAYQDSTLDMAALNTALSNLGYGGLLPSDIVIAGRVSPFPSFVIRDTQIIPNLIPKWTFSGTYPGEVYQTANRIEFSNSGVNARYAYLIEFGAY